MRLNLVGQAYATRSLTAAAQTCVNLYGEPTADPFETAKGPGTLYGAPGKHVFSRLLDISADATPVRGIWAGEGRLFVVAGTKYFEVDSSGHSVGGVYTVADDAGHSPAQIIPNGNQLLIVASGVAYCDNGAGPVEIGAHVTGGTVDTFSVTCFVKTTATQTVAWASGEATFATLKPGDTVMLSENGTVNPYVIATIDYSDGKTMTVTIATQASDASTLMYSYGARWVSGNDFGNLTVGSQLVLPSLAGIFTATAIYDSHNLSLDNNPLTTSGVDFRAYALNGRVSSDSTGKILTWISGDKFQLYGLEGTSLSLNGVAATDDDHTVETVQSPTQLTLRGSTTPNFVFTFGAQPFVAGATGAFIDGYYVVSPAYSRQFNISAIDDGTTWDPLDVAVKESSPDNIQSILACNEQLYLFGKETFEVWRNVGSQLVNGIATFPFQRISGAAQRFGSISPWGPIALAGNVYFIGGTGGEPIAYVLNGFSPVRISTSAVESAWRVADLGRNCVSYGYTEDGHNFWVINFGSQTWCFDATTGAWSERRHWNGTAWKPYRTSYHAFVAEWGDGGVHLTGGGTSADDGGSLFESSVDFYDDNGSDIKWERALPYVYQNPPTTTASPGVSGGNRVYYGRMTLEMEVGTGAPPVITRDSSDDRGKNFVNSQ